jgi:hypothetical protein
MEMFIVYSIGFHDVGGSHTLRLWRGALRCANGLGSRPSEKVLLMFRLGRGFVAGMLKTRL